MEARAAEACAQAGKVQELQAAAASNKTGTILDAIRLVGPMHPGFVTPQNFELSFKTVEKFGSMTMLPITPLSMLHCGKKTLRGRLSLWRVVFNAKASKLLLVQRQKTD